MSSIVIVGEISDTLRAQGNPLATGVVVDETSDSPIVSGEYRTIPQVNVGIMTLDEFNESISSYTQASDNISKNPWNSVGAVGLDAIFTPYSTHTDSGRSPFLPHFTDPSGTTTDPTSRTLNPFNPFYFLSGLKSSGNDIANDVWMESGHNITFAMSYNPHDSGVDGSGGYTGVDGTYPNGSGSPVDTFFEKDHFARHTVETQGIRSVGLKAPMILTGWGVDVDGNPVPALSGSPHPELAWNPSIWKSGPVDFRWDESRGVWSVGSITRFHLVKITNLYTPPSFSFEVDRSNSRDQYSRNAPNSMISYSANSPIYDPESVAYNANSSNTNQYESLDYSSINFPFYEAFVIRATNEDPVTSDYYNIWTQDCQDCGHISNPCASGFFPRHNTSGELMSGKKILIENPLRQSFDVGDLAFTVKTGRKKTVNTGTFSGGSGAGASGTITVNSSGYALFNVTSAGSGYTYGGFGVASGNICANIDLFFSGPLSSGVLTPSGVFTPGTYPVNIYPNDSTITSEEMEIHWVIQAEFKSQQVVTHVECDNGILQTCSVKIQTQSYKSCEWCGEDTAFINN